MKSSLPIVCNSLVSLIGRSVFTDFERYQFCFHSIAGSDSVFEVRVTGN